MEMETNLPFSVDKSQFQSEDLLPLHNKVVKLPDIPIPLWRYIVFIGAMICCVALCIISVVGTYLVINKMN